MRTMTKTGRGAVLLTMCAGMFLVQLDVTVVNVALPTIGARLGAGVAQLQWIVDAYAVVLAALLLTGGALGDSFGHRRVVIAGFAVFGAASAGCALATDTGQLIGFRVLQGIGAALLLPGTLAVITAAYPGRREQARALGIWAGVSALALAGGPLLGGAVVSAVGWRWLFWLNVPLVAVAIALSFRLVPAGAREDRPVDWAGAVTGAVCLASLVYAVIDGGENGIGAGALAVVAGIGFAFSQRRGARPMIPVELRGSAAFLGANVVAGAMNLVGLGTILVATLYLQDVLGAGPLGSAVRMLPLFAPLALLAPVTGRLTARYGPRAPMVAGLALGALGMLNLLRVDPGSGYLTVLPTLAALGAGMGLLTAAVVSAAVGGAPAGYGGVASGVNNTARQAAGAVGVALFGALAGEPGDAAAFTGGLHVIGVVAAAVWLAAIAVTMTTIRQPAPHPPRAGAARPR